MLQPRRPDGRGREDQRPGQPHDGDARRAARRRATPSRSPSSSTPSAAIDWDRTGSAGNNSWYWTATCLKDDFAKAMEVYADVVNNPPFPDDRGGGDEAARRWPPSPARTPTGRSRRCGSSSKTFYGPMNSPYQFMPVGTEENVDGFTQEQMRDWYAGQGAQGPPRAGDLRRRRSRARRSNWRRQLALGAGRDDRRAPTSRRANRRRSTSAGARLAATRVRHSSKSSASRVQEDRAAAGRRRHRLRLRQRRRRPRQLRHRRRRHDDQRLRLPDRLPPRNPPRPRAGLRRPRRELARLGARSFPARSSSTPAATRRT